MSTRAIFVFAVLLFTAGCSVTEPTDPPEEGGPVIAQYHLTAMDDAALPCCAVDSAGVHITVVGGALRFHAPANYRDTVFTPAGPASAACVHGIPNGAFLNTYNHTVTTDGVTYLLLPCDRGTYTMLVVRQLASGNSSTVDTATISAGSFTAGRDHVELIDKRHPFSFRASVATPTIVVKSASHEYRFDPGH